MNFILWSVIRQVLIGTDINFNYAINLVNDTLVTCLFTVGRLDRLCDTRVMLNDKFELSGGWFWNGTGFQHTLLGVIWLKHKSVFTFFACYSNSY